MIPDAKQVLDTYNKGKSKTRQYSYTDTLGA